MSIFLPLKDNLNYKTGIIDIFSGKINSIIRLTDGAAIPMDESNQDYQEYLAWVNAGNTAKSE